MAWDPSPGCFDVLQRKFAGTPNVVVVPMGLSNESGEVEFSHTASTDPTAGIGMRHDHQHAVRVRVTTGDDLVSKNPHLIPNYVKIDVEGYELEVLEGMSSFLADPTIKGIFVEVHFRQLAERDKPKAPAQIVALLRERGFSTSWTDPSHLIAERGGA
jgi:FkbM family methyltransferase